MSQPACLSHDLAHVVSHDVSHELSHDHCHDELGALAPLDWYELAPGRSMETIDFSLSFSASHFVTTLATVTATHTQGVT